MSKDLTRGGPTATPRDGPVQPGSPLYRLLRMIAQEIAQDDPVDRPPARPDPAPAMARPGTTSPLDRSTREA